MPTTPEARLEQAEREIARLRRLTSFLAAGLVLALVALLAPDAGRDLALVALVGLAAVLGMVLFIRLLMAGLGRWDARRSGDTAGKG